MATNNYWMKLWFDILRDPKMGMLPDRLWRRVIELFLIAGQKGEEGLLPDVPEIAWQLNRSAQSITNDLEKIRKTGIVDINVDGVWYVTNFKKRNAPVDSAKRIKDFRQRERYEKGNVDVTEMKRECNEALQLRYQEEQKNRITEEQIKDTTTSDENFAKIVTTYQDVCGVINPITADKLRSAYEEYEPQWIIDALTESAVQNKRNWAYAEAILKRWKVEGRNSKRGKPVQTPEAQQDKFRKLYAQQKQTQIQTN
jgi:DnaD/phage-associated family protein